MLCNIRRVKMTTKQTIYIRRDGKQMERRHNMTERERMRRREQMRRKKKRRLRRKIRRICRLIIILALMLAAAWITVFVLKKINVIPGHKNYEMEKPVQRTEEEVRKKLEEMSKKTKAIKISSNIMRTTQRHIWRRLPIIRRCWTT